MKKISFVTVKIETEINDTDFENNVLNIFPMEIVVNSLDEENVKVISTEITDFTEEEI